MEGGAATPRKKAVPHHGPHPRSQIRVGHERTAGHPAPEHGLLQQIVGVSTAAAGKAAGLGTERRSLLDQPSPQVVIEQAVDALRLLGERAEARSTVVY